MGIPDKNHLRSPKSPNSRLTSETTVTKILAAFGGLALAAGSIGYCSGSFDAELDQGIIECAVPLADEDPTLQESNEDVVICDRFDVLNEDDIKSHAKVVFDKVVKLRTES